MPVPMVQVDAFTARPFGGNPAAVCVLPEPRDAAWMQKVARQMNLSETAFLVRQDGGYDLRWFTPAIEVDLCGHATLGSAHVLWETGQLAAGTEARFLTRSGWLKAVQRGDWIEMDFPAKLESATEPPPALLEALRCQAVYVGKNQFDYLIEVASEAELRALRPNHELLKTLPVRGAIVTARSDNFDFVSRFFAPGAGVDEDPVTGSAHCALAPYWGKKLGRTEMRAFQVSERGGEVRVRLEGDRVILCGQAVTVWHGELLA